MRASLVITSLVVASLVVVAGCDLFAPVSVLGSGGPGRGDGADEGEGDEGEGDASEGEGDVVSEGEGDVSEGEGDVVSEGEGDVVGSCEAVVAGAISDGNADGTRLSADIDVDAGAGSLDLELFFPSAGTFALGDTASSNDNYRTCIECLLVRAGGQTWFATSGTLVLDENPATAGRYVGSVSGASLVEVTIADDFTSTEVSGGSCLDLARWTFDFTAAAPPP